MKIEATQSSVAIGQTPPSGSSRRFRSRIMAGLVLIVPIWLTFVVAKFVFGLMRDASMWMVEAILWSSLGSQLLTHWGIDHEKIAELGLTALPLPVQWGIGACAVVLTVLTLYFLGLVTTNVVGRRFVKLIETIVERIPIVTVIYHASKKVLETLSGDGGQPFQRVVLVPFPNQDTLSVAFLTHISQEKSTGETYYTVFVATAPNPTTGFVFLIKPDKVVEVPWTVEEAIKVIMSGGVLMSDTLSIRPTKSVPDG